MSRNVKNMEQPTWKPSITPDEAKKIEQLAGAKREEGRELPAEEIEEIKKVVAANAKENGLPVEECIHGIKLTNETGDEIEIETVFRSDYPIQGMNHKLRKIEGKWEITESSSMRYFAPIDLTRVY